MPAEEVRVDLQDGRLVTLAQLRKKFAGRYTPEDIDEYWRESCRPVDQGSPGLGVANDPFLTHSAQAPRATPSAPSRPSRPLEAPAERLENVRDNPFLTHGQQQQPEVNLREDPFMTHAQNVSQGAQANYREGQHRVHRQNMLEEESKKGRTSTLAMRMREVLGPGVPNKTQTARNLLMFGPWVVYLIVLLIWNVLQHFTLDGCVVLTALITGFSFCLILAWAAGKRWGPAPLLPLGLLCLAAVGIGVVIGDVGWRRHWRQHWWLQTGHRDSDTSATTPAAARSDAAVVAFNGPKQNGGRSLVDDSRSAAFKDDQHYCVAPVLSPQSAGGSKAMVNFWAVGVNCCSELGSFSCDASRSFKGAFGVVMLEGGFPCPGCHADKFRAAVSKAEAMHGLVSAPGALYIRWVDDVYPVGFSMLMDGIVFFLSSALVGLCIFLIAGFVLWYYGIGDRRGDTDPLLGPASRTKLPPGQAQAMQPVAGV